MNFARLRRTYRPPALQASAYKYASRCGTLTAEEIQRDYRSFRNGRGEDFSTEDVGKRSASFLDETIEEEVPLAGKGRASFEFEDKPQVLLATGSLGIQVTVPVM